MKLLAAVRPEIGGRQKTDCFAAVVGDGGVLLGEEVGCDTVKLRRPSCAVEMTERLWEKIREVSTEVVRQRP